MVKIAALTCGILFTAVSGAKVPPNDGSQTLAKKKYRKNPVFALCNLEHVIDTLNSAKRRTRPSICPIPVDDRLRTTNSASYEVDNWLNTYNKEVECKIQNGEHVPRLKFGNTNPIVDPGDHANYHRTAAKICCEVQDKFRDKRTGMNGFDIPYVPVYDFDKYPGALGPGSLYVTLTICGDGSWKALVKNLHKQYPQKDFVVYTGRHGGVPNRNKDGKTVGVFDADHTEKDIDCMKGCLNGEWEKNGPGTITVIDSGKINGGNTQFNHTECLRAAYRRDLSEGRIVILAWCYSLFTFVEVDAEIELKSPEYVAVTEREINRTVEDLVVSYFHQPDGQTSPESTPSGSITSTPTGDATFPDTDEKSDQSPPTSDPRTRRR